MSVNSTTNEFKDEELLKESDVRNSGRELENQEEVHNQAGGSTTEEEPAAPEEPPKPVVGDNAKKRHWGAK